MTREREEREMLFRVRHELERSGDPVHRALVKDIDAALAAPAPPAPQGEPPAHMCRRRHAIGKACAEQTASRSMWCGPCREWAQQTVDQPSLAPQGETRCHSNTCLNNTRGGGKCICEVCQRCGMPFARECGVWVACQPDDGPYEPGICEFVCPDCASPPSAPLRVGERARWEPYGSAEGVIEGIVPYATMRLDDGSTRAVRLSDLRRVPLPPRAEGAAEYEP